MVEFTLSHLSKNFKVDLYRYVFIVSGETADTVTIMILYACLSIARLLVLCIVCCAIKSDAKSDLFTTGKNFGAVNT